jgi:hypothetical protein
MAVIPLQTLSSWPLPAQGLWPIKAREKKEKRGRTRWKRKTVEGECKGEKKTRQRGRERPEKKNRLTPLHRKENSHRRLPQQLHRPATSTAAHTTTAP